MKSFSSESPAKLTASSASCEAAMRSVPAAIWLFAVYEVAVCSLPPGSAAPAPSVKVVTAVMTPVALVVAALLVLSAQSVTLISVLMLRVSSLYLTVLRPPRRLISRSRPVDSASVKITVSFLSLPSIFAQIAVGCVTVASLPASRYSR